MTGKRLSAHDTRLYSGHPAPTLVSVVLTILGLGLVMIYSTTAIGGQTVYASTFLVRRQALWAVVSILGMVVVSQTDYHIWVRYRYWLLASAILGLVCVFVPGIGTDQERYARRWVALGGFRAQPSEWVKLCLCVVLSAEVCRTRKIDDWKWGFLPLFAGLSGVAFLIAVEPDFGTATFIMVTGMAILIVGGVRLKHVMLMAIPGGLMALLMIATHPYIRHRIHIFLNPDLDPLGKGYQVRQSLLAIASGGLTGRGLGAGRQKLYFLPDDHNDFIVAIVGEELGLLGMALLIGCMILLLWSGVRIMRRARDRVGFLIAFGVTFAICLQAILNLAVVSACMPNKGIPFPFLSSGGSSLFISMLGIGLLLNIARQGRSRVPE